VVVEGGGSGLVEGRLEVLWVRPAKKPSFAQQWNPTLTSQTP
jgi:hypothetical protein